MSSIQNQTKAIFSQMQSDFSQANADQGLGSLGEWPPAGEHNCYVLDVMTSHDRTFRQSSDGQEFPAATVQFTYQLCDDPDRAEPLVFKGAPMTLCGDPTQLTHEGSQIRNRIEMSRLKGHLKTLLSREPNDIAADLDEISTRLNGEEAVAAVVRCQYTERGTRTYRSEYIQTLLGG